MSNTAARTDRRHVRRAQTIEQIVDVALEVMGEHGVAGLSLGEVARRVGIRPPSLYVYFDSKNALYDAVFARGWREIDEVMAAVGEPVAAADLADFALRMAETFVRWTVEHPVYAQLMAWRPVPGYEPSPQAYETAVVVVDRSTRLMEELQVLGLFRQDVEPAELLRAWTVLTSGVMTQQLANAPQQPFETGTFTSMLPQLVAMFLAHYAPPDDPPTRGRA
jgi:AcrR family transcriptional regulator